MKHITFAVSVAGLVLAGVGQSPVLAQTQIAWVNDLQQAQHMARQQQRLLLIHFWADNCSPCLRLEKQVFVHPEVVQAINASYIPVKVNARAMPDVARNYRVHRWPTDVILTPQGEEVHRTVSPSSPQQYVTFVHDIASNASRQLGLVAQGPASGGDRPAGPAGYQERAAMGQQPDPRSAQHQPGNPAQTAGRYPLEPPKPTDQQTRVPDMASRWPGPGGNFPTQEPWQHQAGSQQQDYPPHNAPVGPQYNSSYTPQRQDQARTSRDGRSQSHGGPDRQTSAQRQGQPDAEQPAIAMDGYSPVALVEGPKWEKGDPRWGAIHRGRTYLFAGPEQQQRFLANPDRYSPVLAGFDPVRLVEQGEWVEGRRQHGVAYQEQIYLFADEAALERFWNQPDYYSAAVQQAMQAAGRNHFRR